MRVSAKSLGLAVCAVALTAAGFVLLGSSVDRATPSQAANTPAFPVPVVPVIRRTVPVYLDFVGTTEAIRSVSLQARVTGYLVEQGVEPRDFNSYGARRGNHEVMVRGTFANIRLKNALADREGGFTRHLPSGDSMPTLFCL